MKHCTALFHFLLGWITHAFVSQQYFSRVLSPSFLRSEPREQVKRKLPGEIACPGIGWVDYNLSVSDINATRHNLEVGKVSLLTRTERKCWDYQDFGLIYSWRAQPAVSSQDCKPINKQSGLVCRPPPYQQIQVLPKIPKLCEVRNFLISTRQDSSALSVNQKCIGLSDFVGVKLRFDKYDPTRFVKNTR